MPSIAFCHFYDVVEWSDASMIYLVQGSLIIQVESGQTGHPEQDS